MGERGIGQYTGRGAGRFRLCGVTSLGVNLFDPSANKLAPFQATTVPWPLLTNDATTASVGDLKEIAHKNPTLPNQQAS